MDTRTMLEQFGLSDREVAVYVALLELGTASVMTIAHKAELKRPATYLILDNLQQKGLVTKVPQTKKALFAAEGPEVLLREVNKKQELLHRFLPDLLALHNTKSDKPKVQLHPGKQGIKEAYNQMLGTEEVWLFGTVADVAKVNPEGLAAFASLLK